MCAIKKLPARPKDSHKGMFGHVLVIGGDSGYAGAPVITALGALRCGAGLVTLASRAEHLQGLNAVHPEIMTVAIEFPDSLNDILNKATVIVLGPGLTTQKWGQDLYQKIINCRQPLVLDADGLNILSTQQNKRDNWVLTPHPGEAKRLLQHDFASNYESRLNAIEELVNTYSATVVLKGNNSLVKSPQTDLYLCKHGNPAMATPGMGDLLSGIIAAFIAQGLDLDSAAKNAVELHAIAGDLAAKKSKREVLASDLLAIIPGLLD